MLGKLKALGFGVVLAAVLLVMAVVFVTGVVVWWDVLLYGFPNDYGPPTPGD
jgi:hypothetical protein